MKTVREYICQDDLNLMPKVQKARRSKLDPYKKDIDAGSKRTSFFKRNSAKRPAESLIVWQRSILDLSVVPFGYGLPARVRLVWKSSFVNI